MLIQPFEQIFALQKGQPITALTGKIVSVYPQETKEGQNGPYQTQNVVISDGKNKLKLRFFGFDPITEAQKNRTLFLEQGKNGKGQFSGLKASHWQRTQGQNAGQTDYCVDVNGAAIMTWDAAPGAAQPAAPAQQGNVAAARTESLQADVRRTFGIPQTTPVPPVGIAGIKKVLAREMIAYDLCLLAAKEVCVKNHQDFGELFGTSLDPTDVKDIATTFYIQGSRMGAFANLPTSWSEYTSGKVAAPAAPVQPPPPPPVDTNQPSVQSEVAAEDDVPF